MMILDKEKKLVPVSADDNKDETGDEEVFLDSGRRGH